MLIVIGCQYEPETRKGEYDDGYKHYLDWYFKDWLGESKATERETQVLRFLKRSGFVEMQKA